MPINSVVHQTPGTLLTNIQRVPTMYKRTAWTEGEDRKKVSVDLSLTLGSGHSQKVN